MIGNVDLKLSYDTKIDETMSTENENKDFNATSDKTDVMPYFYYFDINRRVYEKDGKRSNAPFYEEHFVKILYEKLNGYFFKTFKLI